MNTELFPGPNDATAASFIPELRAGFIHTACQCPDCVPYRSAHDQRDPPAPYPFVSRVHIPPGRSAAYIRLESVTSVAVVSRIPAGAKVDIRHAHGGADVLVTGLSPDAFMVLIMRGVNAPPGLRPTTNTLTASLARSYS